jgi:hypothetical protein
MALILYFIFPIQFDGNDYSKDNDKQQTIN